MVSCMFTQMGRAKITAVEMHQPVLVCTLAKGIHCKHLNCTAMHCGISFNFFLAKLTVLPDINRNQAAPVSGRATNNCGEIQAATKAIELSAQCNIKKVCINTDSQFLINSATKWMDAWRARGWTLKSGGRVKNEHDFRDLNRVLTNHPDVQVKWSYVPAHSGIMGNERADTLAKEGAGMYKADKSQ